MKFLKGFFSLVIMVSLLFSFSSCKKDKAESFVTKDQLVGKWSMVLQSGGTVQIIKTELKGSGAMMLDTSTPPDGTPELIFLWDTGNNTFNAHLDVDSIPNAYEMHGNIDPTTLGISGTLKLNDPQSPQTYIFTMDKE